MDRKRNISVPTVGGSSLLTVFAVLVLTVFALMSLSAAQMDKRLSDASVCTVSAYYAADFEAQRILALLRSGEMPEGVHLKNGVYSWAVPISETQELRVEAVLTAGPGGGYRIQRWEAVATREWTPSEDLNLWDGAFEEEGSN